MTVRVPVRVPTGHFAMPFYYDASTGKLEGLPLLAEDRNSVTFATEHFSTVVVSSIAESVLARTPVISTGFKPGVDDWQFTNFGSYAAPGGHCAGQSISAMWYYYEQRLNGAPPLNGRFDNNGKERTEGFWEDDSIGYRFASTIQKEINWDSRARTIFARLSKVDDRLTWLMFVYSMLQTGEPQYVGIRGALQGSWVGHALIVYKIFVSDGTMYLADPNYPGNPDRKIEFWTNQYFKPYHSGLDASDLGLAFPEVRYFAKTALIPWGQVRRRWLELTDSLTKIPNEHNNIVGKDYFPSYTLRIVEEEGETTLADYMTTDKDRLEFRVSSSGPRLRLFIYQDGRKLDLLPGQSVQLEPGYNDLGFYVEGEAEGRWRYVDFQRYKVFRNAPGAVAPSSANIRREGNTTFIVDLANLPMDARFEWDFGDGSPKTTTTVNQVDHTYVYIGGKSPIKDLLGGSSTLTVTVYDNHTGQVVAKASAVIKYGGLSEGQIKDK